MLAACGVLWLAAVATGAGLLERYSSTPGAAAAAPADWPAQTALQRVATLPTLVMLVHPRCPCSRASLGELAEIMTTAHGRLTVHVLFIKPAGTQAGWEQTDLMHRAASIAGVHVITDDAAREAALFGAKTSGQALLYDANARLIFSGGITASRGHSGDSVGRRAVLASLQRGPVLAGSAPVFGCALGDGMAQP